MLPTFSVGPLVIPSASLVYILGIWTALTVVEKAADRLDLRIPATYNLAVIGLTCGFIAARLIFVADHWTAYRENLIGVLWPLTSGFNVWGGLFIGVCASFFYGRSQRLPAGATLDALTPGILVGFMAISLADFLAGPGYGTEDSLPWSISLFGIERHPVQIYEIVTAAVALVLWAAYVKRRAFAGRLFLISAAVFCAGRLLVDAFRANAILTPGGYHAVQILALAALVASMLALMRLSTGSAAEPRSE